MDPRPPVTAQLPPNPSPWRRFIAKWLDLLVLKYILGFFVIMALPLGSTGLYVALTLGLLFLWFAVVEPILLSTLGSTVGNALCGVVVLDLYFVIFSFWE
jgi:hypothetical protein